jgi:hypothetical protein
MLWATGKELSSDYHALIGKEQSQKLKSIETTKGIAFHESVKQS